MKFTVFFSVVSWFFHLVTCNFSGILNLNFIIKLQCGILLQIFGAQKLYALLPNSRHDYFMYQYFIHCFRCCPTNVNQAMLVWGDVGGCVTAIRFNSASTSLFERPSNISADMQGCKAVWSFSQLLSLANAFSCWCKQNQSLSSKTRLFCDQDLDQGQDRDWDWDQDHDQDRDHDQDQDCV